jgi:hypothetical protein
LRRRAAAALRLKLRLFGSGDAGPGLYGIGAYPSLHGTPFARWTMLSANGTRAVLDRSADYRDVWLDARLLPVKVSGRLTGSGSRKPTDLAIALGGTLVATAPTVSPRPNARQVISVLVPEDALREGRNRLDVFAIERGKGRLALRPLRP